MDEFSALQKYKAGVQGCCECDTQTKSCPHTESTFNERILDFFRRPTLLPFILLAFMFFIAQFCGMFAMRPYIAQILYTYRSPVDPKVVVVWLGVLGIVANVLMMAIIRVFGKRSITLISMAITFISCFVLGEWPHRIAFLLYKPKFWCALSQVYTVSFFCLPERLRLIRCPMPQSIHKPTQSAIFR